MTTLDEKKARLGGNGNRPFLNQNTSLLGALEIATGAANANRPYELNLNEISIEEEVQVRVGGLDEETVQNYTAILENGGELPPVKVYTNGVDKWLADGFHRYAAHERAGRAIIKAFVIEGTYEQVLDLAESANLEHGLKLTMEDKRNILYRRLKRNHPWTQMSNGQIARELGVSAMTVGRWVKEFSTITNVIVERTEIKGADGRVINTGNIGRPVAATPNPTSPNPNPFPIAMGKGRQSPHSDPASFTNSRVGSHEWIHWVHDQLAKGIVPEVPAPYEIQPRSGEGSPLYLFWEAEDDGKLFPVHRPIKPQSNPIPNPSPQAGKGDAVDLPTGYTIQKINKGNEDFLPQTADIAARVQEAKIRLAIQALSEAVDKLLQERNIETLVQNSDAPTLKALVAVLVGAITRSYSFCQQILTGLSHEDLIEVEQMLARLDGPIDDLANGLKNAIAGM